MILSSPTSDVESARRLLGDVAAHYRATQKAKGLYRERLAPDFNPLDFVHLDELRLSELMAWLLNPEGNHGQGGAFLEIFSGLTGERWSSAQCAGANVFLEHGSGNGRIDLIVKSGTRAIAIENKPFADDQPEQISRYLQFLDGLALSEYRLLYLTPDGTLPTEYSIGSDLAKIRADRNQLRAISYTTTVLEWLQGCKAVCRADRIAVFIDEMGRSFRKKFAGVADMSDHEHMLDVMLESPQNVLAAMMVANNASAMKDRLISSLQEQLQATADKNSWRMEWNASSTRKWSDINFYISETCPTYVSFIFDRTQFNELSISVRKKEKSPVAVVTTHRESIVNTVGDAQGKATEEHIWWRYLGVDNAFCPLPRDWGTDVSIWPKIADGTAGRAMSDSVERLAQAIKAANG